MAFFTTFLRSKRTSSEGSCFVFAMPSRTLVVLRISLEADSICSSPFTKSPFSDAKAPLTNWIFCLIPLRSWLNLRFRPEAMVMRASFFLDWMRSLSLFFLFSSRVRFTRKALRPLNLIRLTLVSQGILSPSFATTSVSYCDGTLFPEMRLLWRSFIYFFNSGCTKSRKLRPITSSGEYPRCSKAPLLMSTIIPCCTRRIPAGME